MNDAPDSLVLRYVRRIDEKLDRVIDEVGDLRRRVSLVEERISNIGRRLDRFDFRLERVERRLAFIDLPAG